MGNTAFIPQKTNGTFQCLERVHVRGLIIFARKIRLRTSLIVEFQMNISSYIIAASSEEDSEHGVIIDSPPTQSGADMILEGG